MLDKTNYEKGLVTYDLGLPDTLSGLIRVALGDLERVENDPTYKVDMNEWHRPTKSGPCQVCLAGAVITRVLSPNECYVEGNIFNKGFDTKTRLKFYALDSVRHGAITYAAATLMSKSRQAVIDQLHKNGVYDIEYGLPQYQDAPKLFKERLYIIADQLEKAGF